MRYYPLFLDLQDAVCLVAGCGPVGLRKARTLLEYPLRALYLVDPAAHNIPDLDTWIADQRIFVLEREFAETDLEGKSLVFAATPNPQLNGKIAALCAQKGILCNTATGRDGSFIVPASVQSGPLCVAVSSQGASPALSRFIKDELASRLDKGYGQLAVLLEQIRPLILNLGLPQAENARIFKQLCETKNLKALLDPLQNQDAPDLVAVLQNNLPPACFADLPSLAAWAVNHTDKPDTP